jgi:hypothetical protein
MKGIRMKRISLVAALLGAIVLAFAGIAVADTGSVNTAGSSALGGASGNGTQVSHYTATYADPIYGPVSCTGVHQVKNGKSGQSTQENFTCTSTTGSPLQGVTAGQSLTFAPGGWWSDWAYFTQNGAVLPSTGGTGTVSADGMSYSANVTY